ncbi:MAG: hypothetical protein MI862_23815 [Desulfobacterales bacterium]|nr:hypothetical protein [Desulfobacterales bacterium]
MGLYPLLEGGVYFKPPGPPYDRRLNLVKGAASHPKSTIQFLFSMWAMGCTPSLATGKVPDFFITSFLSGFNIQPIQCQPDQIRC